MSGPMTKHLPGDVARAVTKKAAVIGCLGLGLKHPRVAMSPSAPLALEALKEMIGDFKRTWGHVLQGTALWEEVLAEWARWEAAERLPLPD